MKDRKTFSKKCIILILSITLSLLFFNSNSIYANRLSSGWNELQSNESPVISISTSSSKVSTMDFNFSLSGFSSDKVSYNNQEWDNLTFVGQCKTDAVGSPDLPLIRKYFAIPENSEVTVEIINIEFKTFNDVKVSPFQKPLLETETLASRSYQIDKLIYNMNQYYPNKWVRTSEPIIMSGVHLATLVINPLRYNPISKTLQVASKISCRISYSNPQNTISKTFPSHLEKTFKALLLNYNFMDYKMVPTRATAKGKKANDYLILADPDLINATSLTNLVTYHTNQGYTVELKDVSEIGSSANAIKDYIESLYESNELDYVLLVGDISVIPQKERAYSKYDSDSWYSWLDGNDCVGDIGLGRLPASDKSELDMMISKTLNFHNFVERGEWRRKSILIAHRENYPNKYTACSETIYKHDYKLDVPKLDRKYGGESARNSDVTEAINEGRIVVNYRGHGSKTAWTGWCGSSYSKTHVSDLKNGKKTPVVFSVCCLNGDMSSSSHCFAEAFICQEQGAVAILAAKDPSFTTVNHDFNRALYFGTWDEGIEALGDLRNYADAEGIAQNGSSAKSNAAMYIWFGDPLLSVLKGSADPFTSVYSPDGGEKWEQGTTKEITWGDNISGKVKIELFKGDLLKETLTASAPSTGSFEWNITSDYEIGNDYKIKISSVDSTDLNDESNEPFSIIREYIIQGVYFQDFDSLEPKTDILPFKYEQLDNDKLNWTVYSGPTPSRVGSDPDKTGPDGDHTSGNGNYVYVEASGDNSPDLNAEFVTPKFNFTKLGNPKLTFWAHMFSEEKKMGELNLDIYVDGTWETKVLNLTDDHGDQWFKQTVNLNNYRGNRVIFRFRATTGENWCSDICIDDLKIEGVVPINNSMYPLPLTCDLKATGSKIYFQISGNQRQKYPLNIKLYNLQGKMVKTLVNKRVKPGYHIVHINTKQKIATGLYLCRMETNNFIKTVHMVIKK